MLTRTYRAIVVRTLHAEGLTLEPLTVAHADAMFGILCDPALYRFLDYGRPASLADVRDRYARLESRTSPDGSQQWLNWIVRPDDGQPIGYVQATIVTDHTSWIAYLLGSEHWGRGNARRATKAMLDHLIAEHGIRTFMATVEVDNERSIALLDALGFEVAADEQAAVHALSASERLYVRGPRPAQDVRRPT